MFTTNPFADISALISPALMQGYIILMVLLVIGGTVLDMIHKQSAKFFFENSKKAQKAAKRQPSGGEKAGLAVQTLTNEVLMSSEFKNTRRRVSHLLTMYGFVFFVEPGAVPLTNVAYWGPPPRDAISQPALSVNMGPNTNVETISFKYGELEPKKLTFTDSSGGEKTVDRYTRQPPLAARVPMPRKRDFLANGPDGETDQAKRVRAQGEVDKSFDNVVTAEGSLDALRYGRVLKPRSLVDVRGAGDSFDGRFYVKSVTHSIDVKKGEYKQKFSLSREGVGTTTPIVRV